MHNGEVWSNGDLPLAEEDQDRDVRSWIQSSLLSLVACIQEC